MMLDFNNDKTYTKKTVLANVRYALFNPKSLRDDAVSAKFLDLAVVFALIDSSNPYRARYKIIDAMDMVSLDIKLDEIMEAANENCKKAGYDIVPIEDAISDITGMAIPSSVPYLMCIGTNSERILGASILMYERYFEELAIQLNDDLCIMPSSIHELIIVPLSYVDPGYALKTVREINKEIVGADEILSDNIYFYRRNEHKLSLVTTRGLNNLTC